MTWILPIFNLAGTEAEAEAGAGAEAEKGRKSGFGFGTVDEKFVQIRADLAQIRMCRQRLHAATFIHF